jgi:hypothetical protein
MGSETLIIAGAYGVVGVGLAASSDPQMNR